MSNLRKFSAAASIALATSATTLICGGVASADVPIEQAGCSAYNIVGSAGVSTCAEPTWHRVHLVCFKNGRWPDSSVDFYGPYDVWGPAQYGGGLSFVACRLPGTLISVNVVPA